MKRLISVLFLVIFSSAAIANDAGIVKLKSKYSVKDTMDRVEMVAKANGHRIWVREDFQKLGEMSKAKIRPSQVIMFGRGKGGPRLIAVAPTTALDLPLRVTSWEDESGQVWLAYTSPDYWRDRHIIKGRDKVIANINKVLKSVVDEAME